jgi:hypothetical protein
MQLLPVGLWQKRVHPVPGIPLTDSKLSQTIRYG